MDEYVAQGPGGTWVVVVGGQQVGSHPTEQAAQRDLNDKTGRTNYPMPGTQAAPQPQAAPTAGTAGGYSPALTAQLQAQQGMIDASASGNRELFVQKQLEFKQAQRLRYAELFGFDPDTAGGGEGTYNTGNGSRTVAQMTEELVKAGQGAWNPAGKSPEQIAADYAGATRQPVTAATGAPTQGQPTLAARQFESGQYSDMAKSILSAATSLRGPRDYGQYQKMLGGGREVLDQLSGNQAQSGFGMAGTPEPAQISDILSALGIKAPKPVTTPWAAA